MIYLDEAILQGKGGYRGQNRTLDPIPELRSPVNREGPDARWDAIVPPTMEGRVPSSLAGSPGFIEDDQHSETEDAVRGVSRSRWKHVTLLGLAVVCAGLAIFFIGKSVDNVAETPNGIELFPSSAPSVQPDLELRNSTILSDAQLEALDTLLLSISGEMVYSSRTPQGKARLWLFSDNETARNPDLDSTRMRQRYALCVLFFATSGATGWTKMFLDKHVHECDWEGVGCNKNKAVTRLATAGQSLVGTLPEEIGELNSLLLLSIFNNSLTGTLPEGLFRLASLVHMDVNRNQLTGTLPSMLWSLSALTHLDVSSNQFNGTLSSNVWSLPRIMELRLYNNSLIGSFPEIPVTTVAPPLVSLRVQRNYFTGVLPSFLDRSHATIRAISFFDNNFVSNIPSTYSQLTQLSYLDLSFNFLFGTIPPLADKISWLFLDYNNLTGPLPVLPTSTISVWLNNNLFSGIVPPDFGVGLENLTDLHIYGNKLSGEVPGALCNVTDLNITADCNTEELFFVSCGCCSDCI